MLPPAGPRRRPAQRTGPARAEGGFPVPPMDLTVPPSPRLRRADRVAEPVGAGRPEGGVVSSGRRGTGTGTGTTSGGSTGSTAASAQEGTDA